MKIRFILSFGPVQQQQHLDQRKVLLTAWQYFAMLAKSILQIKGKPLILL
jgi:hypothetical protein